MTRTYLVRGMLVGLLASVVAFGFAKAVGEPQIAEAVALEEQLAQQRGEREEEPVVSRAVQGTIGLGTGLVVTGVALGGIFALVFAFVHRRLTQRSARSTAALLAGAAFVTVYFVPFLKYPPNPPSVGDPDTIARRTALYAVLVLASVLATVLTAVIRDHLRPRLGAWDASILAMACFCAAIAVIYLSLPGVDEAVAGFPAVVLWRFRVASLGIQLLLWATIGIAFGALTERAERRPAAVRVT